MRKDKVEITHNLKAFRFENPHYKVRNHIPGVRSFGRHFNVNIFTIIFEFNLIICYKITPYGEGMLYPKRNYTVVLSISRENIEYRDDMMKYFIYRMSSQSNAPSLNNS